MPGVHGFLVHPVTKRGIAGHRQAHARVLDYSVRSIGFNPCYSITSTSLHVGSGGEALLQEHIPDAADLRFSKSRCHVNTAMAM